MSIDYLKHCFIERINKSKMYIMVKTKNFIIFIIN